MRTIFLLALLCPILTNCQPLPITGQVVNEQLQPISGATVVLKRTGASVITGDNGMFSFPASLPSDTLTVSMVGYKAVNIRNNERGKHTIILEAKTAQLDEVVVMAYGTTTRRLNTGNIGVITTADIERQPVSNPLATLQGRIPGLIVTQTSGVAGSAFNMQLRGRTSLDLSLSRNDPLIIIDGVPFEPGNLATNQIASAVETPYRIGNVFPGGISALNGINPSDIESISVLKDADATAIYGSRGANGVLLITTKKAKRDKATVSISAETGWSRATHLSNFLTTPQYLEMRREAFANDGVTPTTSNAPDLLLWDTTRYTDFKRMFIGNTARTSNFQGSVSGGTGDTRFRLTGAHMIQTSVYYGRFADRRSTAQFNLTHTPQSNSWDTRFSMYYGFDDNKLPQTDYTRYLSLPPHLKLLNADGSLAWQDAGVSYTSLGFRNPLAEDLKEYNSANRNLNVNWQLAYKPLTSLVLKFNSGYNSFSGEEFSSFPKAGRPEWESTLAASTFANTRLYSWIIEPQANYTWKNSKSDVAVLVGATWQHRNSESRIIEATNYTNDIMLHALDAAGNLLASNTEQAYRYEALFARLNVNHKGKYIINLSGRRDGSSRFAPGKRFSNFGAIGGAWIITQNTSGPSFVSFAKLRGSFGITGNDQIGDYRYLDLWSTTALPYQGVPGLRPTSLFNPVFQWEKNRKWEAGTELALFRERVQLNVVFFNSRSSNQLVNYRLPSATGFTSVIKNLPAIVQNSGWEIIADATVLKIKNLTWRSSINITIPSNKLVSFPELGSSSYSSLYVEGQPLSLINRIRFLGVDPQTGLYTFEDLNKDGILNSQDKQIMGSLDPTFYGGWSHEFSFGSFQLNGFIHFVKQTGNSYLASPQYLNPPGFVRNHPDIVLTRWRKPGDISPIQRYGASVPGAVFTASNQLSTSNAIYADASFLRLKNVSVAYRLNPSIARKLGISAGKIYAQAQNLFTITNYLGADPETQNFYQLPPLKSAVIGIQLTF